MKENASMKKKYIRTITIIAIIISCYAFFFTEKNISSNQQTIDFYDLNFLHNTKAVEKVLKEAGFLEINFKTQDGLLINTIMLDQSHTHDVTATIISFPGFVPGNKEGMSTLYAMLQNKPYNFMLIDSRGHGKSDGELLTYQGFKSYGQLQYFDMIAAIKYITEYNKKHTITNNIIIHGLCSGAYHTVKAVAYIKKYYPEIYPDIKGIILDSAWSSIPEIADTVIKAESKKRCTNYFIPYLEPYVTYLLQTLYTFFFKTAHNQQIPIKKIINTIDQPILFIHAEDDEFVPVHNIYPLIAKAKNPTYWIVKNSSHVNNHIDYKDIYSNKIESFINSVV